MKRCNNDKKKEGKMVNICAFLNYISTDTKITILLEVRELKLLRVQQENSEFSFCKINLQIFFVPSRKLSIKI